MKKISTLLIMLMILISISSIALADEAEDDLEGETEESDVDNETVTEIEIMNYSIGAELRLLQLEKAILKNLLKGEMAVEVLKGLEYNTTELEKILSEMRILLEEVRAVNASSNNSVQLFVEFKSMAMNLTKQFRETINNSLDGEKLIQIRERIREMMSEELETCSNMVRNKIKQFNRNQLYKLYGLNNKNRYVKEKANLK